MKALKLKFATMNLKKFAIRKWEDAHNLLQILIFLPQYAQNPSFACAKLGFLDGLRTGLFIPVLSLIAISLYNCHGVMLWLLSEMQFNVRFAETLLSPFPFTISKLVLAVPVPLMVDMIT